MKAFSFRLETLLHLREMAKDKAIADYGLAIAKREASQNVLQERKLRLEDLREEIGRRRSTGFSGSEQSSYNRSIDRAKEAIIDANSNFEEAKKENSPSQEGIVFDR